MSRQLLQYKTINWNLRTCVISAYQLQERDGPSRFFNSHKGRKITITVVTIMSGIVLFVRSTAVVCFLY